MTDRKSAREDARRSRRRPEIGFRIAGTNVELSLPNQPVVEMGTSPECDVVIDDRLVSAFHAPLERRKASLWYTAVAVERNLEGLRRAVTVLAQVSRERSTRPLRPPL